LLVDNRADILQVLAETIMSVTQCDLSGLILLTNEDGERRFNWRGIAGAWKPRTGGGTPWDCGPCGDALDRNCTLLFRHFERRYTAFRPIMPPAEECLIVSFYVDGTVVGTMWTVMHSDLLNKQIAGELGATEVTIKAHRSKVMRKMRAVRRWPTLSGWPKSCRSSSEPTRPSTKVE
jgi:hypothetical protein